MIGLLCLFLALLISPFKSKGRLEAENAALRHQLIVLRRKVRGRPDEQRSLVLYQVVSVVSVDPAGPDNHSSRDARALAQSRLWPLLALEIAPTRRAAASGPTRAIANAATPDSYPDCRVFSSRLSRYTGDASLLNPAQDAAGVRVFRLSTACTGDALPSIKWAIAPYTNRWLSSMLMPANTGDVTSMLKCPPPPLTVAREL